MRTIILISFLLFASASANHGHGKKQQKGLSPRHPFVLRNHNNFDSSKRHDVPASTLEQWWRESSPPLLVNQKRSPSRTFADYRDNRHILDSPQRPRRPASQLPRRGRPAHGQAQRHRRPARNQQPRRGRPALDHPPRPRKPTHRKRKSGPRRPTLWWTSWD